MDITEKRKSRFLFLNKLYEVTEGNSSSIVNMWELGKEVGFDKNLVSNIVDYLRGEYLIESRTLGGGISITHEGIIEIEELHNNPDLSTEHFPAINIIHVENMNNSSIQQGTVNSQQVTLFDNKKRGELNELIEEFERIKSTLSLSSDDLHEFDAEVETLKSQSKSPKPKKMIITESLKTIRNLVEGIAGNAIAPGIIEMINRFL